jgi:adenylate kinase family enzyme
MIRRADDNIQTLLKRLKIFNDNIEDILRIMGGPIYFINNENDIKDTIQNIRKFL